MPAAEFRAAFGGVFEHSPWVAERAFAARPFASVDALHAAMAGAVKAAGEDEPSSRSSAPTRSSPGRKRRPAR